MKSITITHHPGTPLAWDTGLTAGNLAHEGSRNQASAGWSRQQVIQLVNVQRPRPGLGRAHRGAEPRDAMGTRPWAPNTVPAPWGHPSGGTVHCLRHPACSVLSQKPKLIHSLLSREVLDQTYTREQRDQEPSLRAQSAGPATATPPASAQSLAQPSARPARPVLMTAGKPYVFAHQRTLL